jgi:hypothetical protein
MFAASQIQYTYGNSIGVMDNPREQGLANRLRTHGKVRDDGNRAILVINLVPARVLSFEEEVTASECETAPRNHARCLGH